MTNTNFPIQGYIRLKIWTALHNTSRQHGRVVKATDSKSVGFARVSSNLAVVVRLYFLPYFLYLFLSLQYFFIIHFLHIAQPRATGSIPVPCYKILKLDVDFPCESFIHSSMTLHPVSTLVESFKC